MQTRKSTSHSERSTCIRHRCMIKALGRHLRARAEQQTHYWRHLKAQYSDRLQYYRLRALSRLREEGTICLIQDGMDQSKVSVPRHPAVKGKEFSTMMRPKCHVSLTLVHGFLLLYALSNPDTSKDSNMTIETLAHTLTVLVKEFRVDLTQVHLCIQVDNTCREAKNNMVLRWCAAQVSCGNVKSISLNSLRSGHSHEDVDQCFGQLARCIARHKRAATLDHFMQIVGDFAKGMHRPHEEGRYTVKVDDARDWNPAQHFITILESVCVVLTPSFGLVVSDASPLSWAFVCETERRHIITMIHVLRSLGSSGKVGALLPCQCNSKEWAGPVPLTSSTLRDGATFQVLQSQTPIGPSSKLTITMWF